jgi:DNA-binding MarR family transcriptional regulator
MGPDRERLADVVLDASRTLLAIAVRSVSAGLADVTVVQHRVLVLLDARGTMSVTAIADELGVDQSNASRHCSGLARVGLVTRTRAVLDRRAVDVALTDAGRRHVQVVRAARRREIARIIATLPDSEVAEVARAFKVFNRGATATGQAPRWSEPATSL